jgi:hypothetical protein
MWQGLILVLRNRDLLEHLVLLTPLPHFVQRILWDGGALKAHRIKESFQSQWQ